MITKRQLSIVFLGSCLLASGGFCSEEGGGARGGRTSPVGARPTDAEWAFSQADAIVASWKGRPPQPLAPSVSTTSTAPTGPMTADMHKKAMEQVQRLMQLGSGGPSALRSVAGGASSDLPEDEIAKSRVADLTSGQVLHSSYMLQAVLKDMSEEEWLKVHRWFKELKIKCIAEQDYISILSHMRGISEAEWPERKERIQAMYARRIL